LFLAHGCGGSATDFFDKSKMCKECIGQPVERYIAQQALSRGLAVIAISSNDRFGNKCWDDDDVAPVRFALTEIMKKEGLGGKKLLAIGASSGGGFVGQFAGRMPAQDPLKPAAVAVQIMGLNEHTLSIPHFPPVAFWHMPKDSHLEPHIVANIAQLKKKYFPVHDQTCNPLQVGDTFFSDWTRMIDEKASAEIVKTLRDEKWIDAQGYLTKDPRRYALDLEMMLRDIPPVASGKVKLKADSAPLPELLNTAYAQHSWCAEGLEGVFAFLFKHAGLT